MSLRFPEQLKAVVFDLDGTLIDTAPEFVSAVSALRAAHDLEPLPEDLVRSHVSEGARALVTLALGITVEEEEFEEKRLQFLDIYAGELGSAARLYAGIEELLQVLVDEEIAWGISTNKPSYLTHALLERLGLDPAPASVVCPDHVSRPKPDPEPLLLSCEQLACAPEDAIYIGDHSRDIVAGRSAGMHTIAAAYGYIMLDDNPRDWGADSVAESGYELATLIANAFD